MKVGGVIIALILDLSTEPVHDWTVQIGKMTFGLMQFGDSDCYISLGSPFIHLPFSAPVVACGLLLIVLLLLFAAWHFIGNLRHRDAPGDA